MTPFARATLLMSALAGLIGCATVAGIESEPLTAGQVRAFDAPLPRVVNATRAALLGANLEVQSLRQLDSLTWQFVAKRTAQTFTWGELVRVVVQSNGARTSVYVVTQRRMATNITARGDWSEQIFAQIAADLQLNR